MIVKLRRSGPEGACWMLSHNPGSNPEWLENSDALDALIQTGLAWVDAEFQDGRRVVATPVPPAEARIVAAPSTPRERAFRIVASV
jgi:hypothetical protein